MRYPLLPLTSLSLTSHHILYALNSHQKNEIINSFKTEKLSEFQTCSGLSNNDLMSNIRQITYIFFRFLQKTVVNFYHVEPLYLWLKLANLYAYYAYEILFFDLRLYLKETDAV